MRRAYERGKRGSREGNKGRQDTREQAARGKGKQRERASDGGRQVAAGTWGEGYSQGRGWDGGGVSSRQSSRRFRQQPTLCNGTAGTPSESHIFELSVGECTPRNLTSMKLLDNK